MRYLIYNIQYALYILMEFGLSHAPTPPIFMTLYLTTDNIQLVQVQDLEFWEESESLLSQDNKRLRVQVRS